MTDRELEQLEKDARRPNRGAKYYPPEIVLRLIEELRKARKSTAALEAVMVEEKFEMSQWSNDTRVKVIQAPLFDAV